MVNLFVSTGAGCGVIGVVALRRVPNAWLSKEIRSLNLTATEQKDLVAFMEALTGQVAPEVSSPSRLPE
jgi:hypothetical protein